MRWFRWVCRGADITMHASNQYFFSCPFSKSVPRCTSRVSWLLAVLSVLGSAAFSGCGNSSTAGKYRVSGTVTLDGEDVTNGFVTFVPDGDRFISSDAGYISDGRFSFEAWPGPKRVEIEAIRFTDGPDDPLTGGRPTEQYIPKAYNVDSTLRVEVVLDGKNNFSFDLVSDVARR